MHVGLAGKLLIEQLGEPAGAGVHARNVGRQQQHATRLGTNPPPRLGQRGAASIPLADPKKFPRPFLRSRA